MEGLLDSLLKVLLNCASVLFTFTCTEFPQSEWGSQSCGTHTSGCIHPLVNIGLSLLNSDDSQWDCLVHTRKSSLQISNTQLMGGCRLCSLFAHYPEMWQHESFVHWLFSTSRNALRSIQLLGINLSFIYTSMAPVKNHFKAYCLDVKEQFKSFQNGRAQAWTLCWQLMDWQVKKHSLDGHHMSPGAAPAFPWSLC